MTKNPVSLQLKEVMKPLSERESIMYNNNHIEILNDDFI